jgi:prolyl-tRNA synthetase
MSTYFLRTLRDDPADAEVASHRLLVRAGYIRRVAPGIYSWLPLGYRVLRQVERVVREEMDAAGFQEVHFPALLPREPYEATHRWVEYGPNLFRLKDRKGGDYLLGPTHEEMFTLLVKDLYSSYKDLPLSIYQIQTKYRDEARPRAGILRGREFVMKDSYSFDADDAGLAESYRRHRESYFEVFRRLSVDFVVVQATSGAMGGSASEEFLSPADSGEDTYVRCTDCEYAANVEAVSITPPPSRSIDGLPAAHAEHTPEAATIATLVDRLNELYPRPDGRAWAATDTLKSLIVMLVHPDGTREPLSLAIPGDREVDDKRLAAQVEPAVVDDFTEADFARYPSLVKGYMGPRALGSGSESGIRMLVDPRVVPGSSWVAGADAAGDHVLDLVAGRDFPAAGDENSDGTVDAAEVLDGDPCPSCGAALQTARGIEIGHVFQLGRKYAEALGLRVLDVNGRLVTVTMGSYGIGISRLVAVIAENHHDAKGLAWPREVAPADVHLVATGKDPAVWQAAEKLASDLDAAGVVVLFDDRWKASPGVKFADAELIGIPTIVTVGRRLAEGIVEVRERASDLRRDVAVDEVLDELLASCRRR